MLGVLPVNTYLVRYRDGHGQEAIKLAVMVPGGDMYFFARDAVDSRPAQTWLKDGVAKKVK